MVAPFLVLLVALLAVGQRLLADPRSGWMLLAYLAAGLAVLAKGLPGLALPLAVLLAWGALGGSLRRDLQPRGLLLHGVGLVVVVLVALKVKS